MEVFVVVVDVVTARFHFLLWLVVCTVPDFELAIYAM